MFDKMKTFNLEKLTEEEQEKQAQEKEAEQAKINLVDSDPSAENKKKINPKFLLFGGAALLIIIIAIIVIVLNYSVSSKKTPALEVTNLNLKVGEATTITSSLSADEYKKLTWFSNDSSVVKVEDGKVEAIGEGNAIIRATYPKGKHENVSVVVESNIEKFFIEETSLELQINETKELNLKGAISSDVKWSSSLKEIATVENGQVRGKHVGYTTIIAINSDGQVAKVKVLVKGNEVALESFAIEAIKGRLDVGDTYNLRIIKEPLNAYASFNYQSNNPNILRINKQGKITVTGSGETSVRVESHNGLEKAITIKIR